MILHPPFIITARLAPGLRLADATLSLLSCRPGDERRMRATFVLDIPGQPEYIDDSMQSGNGGFRSLVEAFEGYLSFMTACGSGIHYGQRTGRKSENSDLFPTHIAEWIADNLQDIENAAWGSTSTTTTT